MLVTSMPLQKVVEVLGEEDKVVLEAMTSAPREQREELSAEQEEVGLGDLDPITSLSVESDILKKYSRIPKGHIL